MCAGSWERAESGEITTGGLPQGRELLREELVEEGLTFTVASVSSE